jgi:CBS domain-containing protein
LPHSVSIASALEAVVASRAPGLAVVNVDGQVVGGVSRAALERVPVDERSAPISTVTVRVAVDAAQTLDAGMQALAEAGSEIAPVVDGNSVVGLVTVRGIMRAYRAAAQRTAAPA